MFERFYPYEYVDSVFAVDYEKLYRMGVRGVIFDIDNTLVHHGDDSNPQVDGLFREIHGIGLKTLLLSNNSDERIAKFTENIDTPYIAEAGKPGTAGYFRALEIMGVKKSEAVMIGDQIFTDIRGANDSGIKGILVKFLRRPEETRIGKKRTVEKLILGFYKRNKKYTHRMGDILKEDMQYVEK